MRYTLISIGLLMMLPTLAQAASERCDQIANQITAVSPYMQQVLSRADAGIAFAETAGSTDNFEPYEQNWIEHIEDTWRNLTDTQLQRRRQYETLLHGNSCIQLDRFLLHCKLEEVRGAIHNALERQSWAGVWRLSTLLTFLHEREEHLLRGATRPQYRDSAWHRNYFFDDPNGIQYGKENENEGVCGDSEKNAGEQCDDGNTQSGDGCNSNCVSEMCAFTSDYLPVSVRGTGCDIPVLSAGNRRLFAPVQDAYESLILLKEARARLETDGRSLQRVHDQLKRLTGEEIAPAFIQEEAVVLHSTISGCQDTRGQCQGNSSISCAHDIDCTTQNAGLCIETALSDTVLTARRRPFSLEVDHFGLLSAFQALRREEGLSRRQRQDLLFPEELDDEEQDTEIVLNDLLTEARRPNMRRLYRGISGQQGIEEAETFGESIDPQRAVSETLLPLRQAIARLAQTAGERTGLRSLVEKTAYYLLRTCLDGPCNLRLQHIVKIAQTDECFPYVNGAFLEDTCSNPRWKKCIDAIRRKEAGWNDPSFDPFEIEYPEIVCEEDEVN